MPEVIIIKRAPIYASMLSSAVHQLIVKAGTISTSQAPEDISNMQFVTAVLALSHANSVAVMVNGDMENSSPGVLAIVQALCTLGKELVLISDASNKQLVEDCVLNTMPSLPVTIVLVDAIEQDIGKKFDCYVLIGNNSSLYVKELFPYSDTAIHIQDCSSKLDNNHPNTSQLLLQSAADCTIISAAPNLGVFGLMTGLQLATSCSVHCRYKQRGIANKPAVLIPELLLTTGQVLLLSIIIIA